MSFVLFLFFLNRFYLAQTYIEHAKFLPIDEELEVEEKNIEKVKADKASTRIKKEMANAAVLERKKKIREKYDSKFLVINIFTSFKSLRCGLYFLSYTGTRLVRKIYPRFSNFMIFVNIRCLIILESIFQLFARGNEKIAKL